MTEQSEEKKKQLVKQVRRAAPPWAEVGRDAPEFEVPFSLPLVCGSVLHVLAS